MRRGRLERSDLGAGGWVLVTADGERLTLMGDVPAKLEGKRVQVEGEIADAMGFAMQGPVLAVRRIRAD